MAPEVVFHPSVIERFALAAPGLSDSARRTLRTNQRFIARRVVPALHRRGHGALYDAVNHGQVTPASPRELTATVAVNAARLAGVLVLTSLGAVQLAPPLVEVEITTWLVPLLVKRTSVHAT